MKVSAPARSEHLRCGMVSTPLLRKKARMRDLLFKFFTKSSLVPKMLKSVRMLASSSSQCSLSDSKRSMRPHLWMKWPIARNTWS